MQFLHQSRLRKMKEKIWKILDQGIIIFVGVLFIFSGLVKLNDPIGTEIKLEEYFEVFSTDFAGFFKAFIPASLELGMILIILEIVLGVAVLLKFRLEYISWILLLLIIFFTFLTFYSAYFNKVTDCGCFGDAVPLTPWQSFTKDIILVVLILHIFWYRKSYKSLVSDKVGSYVLGSLTAISLFLGIYAIEHLPFIDFRPYKVGDNIYINMQPEEQPIFEYTFLKDGEEVRSIEYLPEDQGYEFKGYQITNEDKTIPKITDYNVWNNEVGDYTEQTFIGKKLFIIIYDASKARLKKMNDISTLIEGVDNDVEVLILTASDPTTFEEFRHEYQLAVPYYFTDATVLKAMIRSNPGTMVLKNGTVQGKWHINDTPTASEVNSLL